MKIISIDTETGGLDAERHAIIQLGVVVWDSVQHEIARAEWVIADDPGDLEAEALSINGFTRERIVAEGKPARVVWYEFTAFVREHCGDDPTKVVPVGQGIAFDLKSIQRLARLAGLENPRRALEAVIGRRPLDTIAVAQFLRYIGVLPEDASLSLAGLTARFFPHLGSQKHTACDDAWRTAMLVDAFTTCLISHGFNVGN